MNDSKVLVTGGAGFIGSHLTSELVKRNCRVTVLDDLSGGFVSNVGSKARFIQGSITDERLIRGLFSGEKFDYVFHLAAYAAEGLSHFIKRFNYENNLLGSVNLINASINHEVKCFVFTSSIAVYGRNQVPMTEEMVPAPEDPYGIAKFAVEQELRVSHAMFGLNYVIFRPHNVYGECQNIGDRYRNVIGIFMNQIMRGQAMTIFGDGEQTRAFTYVEDIVPALADAPVNRIAQNRVFNIGADAPCTVNELARQVARSMGVSPKVQYLEPRNEIKHAFSTHHRLEEVFGYRPRFSLQAGLKKMAEWARAVGSRQSKFFDQIEIAKKMPPSWQQEFAGARAEAAR